MKVLGLQHAEDAMIGFTGIRLGLGKKALY